MLASRDAERIRRQLQALEDKATSLGEGGFEPRVRATGEQDRMGSRVAALVDRERELRRRQEADYATIDDACRVLYGDDGAQGLDALVPPIWADVLWWRYLDGATWEEVGANVGYSARRCFDLAQEALRMADQHGLASRMERHWQPREQEPEA